MFFCIFFIASAVSAILALYRFGPPEVRFPFAVYAAAYFITTAIGATLIGVTQGTSILWALANPGLDTMALELPFDATYWFILYAPLIVIPLTVLVLSRTTIPGGNSSRLADRIEQVPIDLPSFCLVFGAFSAYCFLSLLEKGYIANLLTSGQLHGDFKSIIQLRIEMSQNLSPVFYGIVYTTLPFFSNIALYQSLIRGGKKWIIAFCVTFIVICYFNLTIMLKGVLLVYFISLGCGIVVLNKAKPHSLIIGGILGFSILTLMQFFMQNALDVAQSVSQIFFRMANSFPFYLELYPHSLPFMGTNNGLSLIGLEANYDDVIQVFNVMYPGVSWIQGQAAAPAHVRGYAQGGAIFSVMVLVVISLLVFFFARFGRIIRGPLSFAIYVQGLVMLYYLTQASIGGALIQSYGFKWALIGIASIVAWHLFSRFAVARETAN